MGNQRIYEVDAAWLRELEEYARSFWGAALTRYRRVAERAAEESRTESP